MPVVDWKHKPGVRAVVIDDAGRVMMLLRPDDEELFGGYWNLPGGGKETGETYLEGATRELEEETGIEADYTGISMPFRFPGGSGMGFLYRNPRGDLAVSEREAVEVRWFYPNELPGKLMPGTLELIQGLAGTRVDRPMAELTLTAKRLHLEDWAARAIRPWLVELVTALAPTYGLVVDRGVLTKAIAGSPRALVTSQGAKGIDMREIELMGEKQLAKMLTRAAKMGRSEAARAILLDAKEGVLSPSHREGFQAKTIERLRGIARRNVRLIREHTESQLAYIARMPEAGSVEALIAKLTDMKRSKLIGVDTVATGYAHGVVEVLSTHGYRHIFVRTMGDDAVCKKCSPWHGTKMTITRFLKVYPRHPRCRCYPSITPLDTPPQVRWRATHTRRVLRPVPGRITFYPEDPMSKGIQTLLVAVRALSGDQPTGPDLIKAVSAGARQVNTQLLSEIAKKRNRGPGGKFGAGKVTGTDVQGTKNQAQGDAPPKMGAHQPTKNAPNHLIGNAQKLLDQLRNTQPGTPKFKELHEQYEQHREAIRAWNKSKGASGDALPKKVAVPVPKAPTWIKGGDGALQTPHQFEIAAMQAKTKEDAIELGHYYASHVHHGKHGGDAWDRAWEHVKEAIATLPSKDDPAPQPDHITAAAEAGAQHGAKIAAQAAAQGVEHQFVAAEPGAGEKKGQAKKPAAKPAPAKPKAKSPTGKSNPKVKASAGTPSATPASSPAASSSKPAKDYHRGERGKFASRNGAGKPGASSPSSGSSAPAASGKGDEPKKKRDPRTGWHTGVARGKRAGAKIGQVGEAILRERQQENLEKSIRALDLAIAASVAS